MLRRIVPYVIVIALSVTAIVTAMYAGKEYEPFRVADLMPAVQRTSVFEKTEGPAVDYAQGVVVREENVIVEIDDVPVPAGNIVLSGQSSEMSGLTREEIYASVIRGLYGSKMNDGLRSLVYAAFRDKTGRVFLAAGFYSKENGTDIGLYLAEDETLYELGHFVEKLCYDPASGELYLQEEIASYAVDGHSLVRTALEKRPQSIYAIPFTKNGASTVDAAALTELITELP